MNLSSLVHGSKVRHGQALGYFSQPQATSMKQQTMAVSLVANSYTTQSVPQSYIYMAAPQAPPSPPVEEAPKCSLPSISSLLGLADGPSSQEPLQQPTQPAVEYRQSPQYAASTTINVRSNLPPTPPMQSESGFDGRQSPSALSTSQYSVVSAPSNYEFAPGSSINNVEPHAQRQNVPAVSRRVSMPYAHSQYAASPYSVSPSQQSMSSYYASPMQPTPPQQQISGLYYQRPLPQNFPPPQALLPVSVTLTPSSGANPWQHHHYISPSSAASFPQSQDRYICQTCNKAFSRPSSLRIHSHSHTGEKPFKCPHQGCGKAFSVRSNMKRHERGCHSFEGVGPGI